jgi:hypothetical protein
MGTRPPPPARRGPAVVALGWRARPVGHVARGAPLRRPDHRRGVGGRRRRVVGAHPPGCCPTCRHRAICASASARSPMRARRTAASSSSASVRGTWRATRSATCSSCRWRWSWARSARRSTRWPPGWVRWAGCCPPRTWPVALVAHCGADRRGGGAGGGAEHGRCAAVAGGPGRCPVPSDEVAAAIAGCRPGGARPGVAVHERAGGGHRRPRCERPWRRPGPAGLRGQPGPQVPETEGFTVADEMAPCAHHGRGGRRWWSPTLVAGLMASSALGAHRGGGRNGGTMRRAGRARPELLAAALQAWCVGPPSPGQVGSDPAEGAGSGRRPDAPEH